MAGASVLLILVIHSLSRLFILGLPHFIGDFGSCLALSSILAARPDIVSLELGWLL